MPPDATPVPPLLTDRGRFGAPETAAPYQVVPLSGDVNVKIPVPDDGTVGADPPAHVTVGQVTVHGPPDWTVYRTICASLPPAAPDRAIVTVGPVRVRTTAA